MPKEFLYDGKMSLKPINDAIVVDSGEIRDFKYVIVDARSHPTAYIEAKSFTMEDLDGRVHVHGGFTYEDTLPNVILKQTKFPDFTGKWLGWDYCHYGDYRAMPEAVRSKLGELLKDDEGRKWTFKEVSQHVRDAIFGIYALLL